MNMKNLPLEIAVGALLGSALPEMVRQMSQPGISRYKIAAKGLPQEFDGLKIVHLSDLHNKRYGRYNVGLVRMIEQENPDIVVMTGDMISHGAPNVEDFIGMTVMLCRKYPVYYVNGNHEYSDMDSRAFKETAELMRKAGAVCLDNACVILKRGEGRIRLYGLCYPARFYRGVRQYKFSWTKFTLEDMLRYCGDPPEDFSVLLAHNPLDFDVHAEWGADISFGGHIHGGFIRLPVVGGIISPELKLFPKYKEGVYKKKNGSTLVVSRGLGRIRFFNPPELVSVTLRKKF